MPREHLSWKTRNALNKLWEQEEFKAICRACWTDKQVFPRKEDRRCCCSHCASYGGYFHEAYQLKNALLAPNSKWTKKYGFWTENGCSLPRDLRSDVCISFYCSRFSEEHYKKIREAMKSDYESFYPGVQASSDASNRTVGVSSTR